MSKVRMQGPANTSGFSHDGTSYDADENDVIEVPSHIVEHAKAHGFTLIAEKGPKKPEPLAKDAGNAKGGKNVKTEAEDAGNAKGGDSK